MEKLQARGEIPEEELKAIEVDITGKVLFSSRFFLLGNNSHIGTILDHVGVVARDAI